MKETAADLYGRYQSLMNHALEEAAQSPEHFLDPAYVESLRLEIDKFQVLIGLYADLMLASPN